jgi:tetratricopeptide (TPR) repeat protein
MGDSSGSIAGRKAGLCLLLLTAVLAAYSNHFHNDFHFDDGDAIQRNPAIRDPAMIPRFFVDPKLFSALPAQRSYRPVTSASLAIDYWLGGGLDPFFFHLSTFLWYEVQLVLMFLLFGRIMDLADPHPSNVWTALIAVAAFGLHPASAETVNYIIQRADLYNALGCVASLWLFVRYPSQRKFAWYLLPAAAAILAKPPALIFPLLLLVYALLFEQDGTHRAKWAGAIRSTLPALAVTGAVGWLLWRMRVSTWTSVAPSPLLYRVAQPWMALHYFRTFFLPDGLNVDPRWHYVGPFSPQALAGYLFVLGLLGAAVAASRTRSAKPVAFGILWFLITLLPTSLMPLLDVTNDHRMFFAFVGLALAAVWGLRMVLFRLTARLTRNPVWTYGALSVAAVLLVLAGLGTRERNRVWLTEESLWRDSTRKNPQNGRAWDSYGWAFFRQGDYSAAVSLFERAAATDPACPICEAHLVQVYVQLNRDELAQRHLQRLVELDPPIPDPYVAYGDWLHSVGRLARSGKPLEQASRLYPDSQDLRRILFEYYMERDAAARTAVFNALDANHDLTLSSLELSSAPAALAALDTNRDGKLSAEECSVRKEFMHADPILEALDIHHDGEIQAAAIRGAERELLTLDRDGDGQLEPREIVPPYVTAVARRILAVLDLNHDGQIDSQERIAGERSGFGDLLHAAVDRDGIVTLDQLINEIFYRADLNKDGIVTPEELKEAQRSGLLGR